MAAVRGSSFLTDFISNSNTFPFVLYEPLLYISALLETIVDIPAGFRTDVCSIPWLVQWIIPKEGEHNRPGVVHDWLYATGLSRGKKITRKDADDVLLEALTVVGVRWTRRTAIYVGVRLGGWWPWHKYRRGTHRRGR